MASQKTLSSTYYLAHTARSKLSREAAKPDFNLRVLVGHANMLDNLMLDLHEAEKQASMFVEAEDNFDVQTTTVEVAEPKSISWRVAEETPRQKVERELQEAAARREQEQDIDSDTDSDYDEDEDEDTDPEEMMELDVAKAVAIKGAENNHAIHEDEDSDLQDLQLTRTLSRSPPFEFSGFSSPSSASTSAQRSTLLQTIPESDSEYDDLPELMEESSASLDSDDEDSLHSPPLTPPSMPMELDELNVMRKPALPEKSTRRQKPFGFSSSTRVEVVEAY